MVKDKEEIERKFGDSLTWEPVPGKKACRIRFDKKIDGFDKENWPNMIAWHPKYMVKFEAAIRQPLVDVNKLFKEKST